MNIDELRGNESEVDIQTQKKRIMSSVSYRRGGVRVFLLER